MKHIRGLHKSTTSSSRKAVSSKNDETQRCCSRKHIDNFARLSQSIVTQAPVRAPYPETTGTTRNRSARIDLSGGRQRSVPSITRSENTVADIFLEFEYCHHTSLIGVNAVPSRICHPESGDCWKVVLGPIVECFTRECRTHREAS